MANKVLGMHRLKNKVNRNAFDLTHRQSKRQKPPQIEHGNWMFQS